MLARFIVDGVDDDVCPEPRAVLANPLRFVFIFALRQRDCERSGRLPASAILLRIEAREIVANDLVGLIALDQFGPDIPVGNPAIHIEHIDRIVAHALNQQTEPLLAFV